MVFHVPLRALLALLLCAAAPVAATPAGAPPPATAGGGKVYLTVQEALDLAFAGCTVEKETVFLTEAQHARAEKLAKAKIPNKIVHAYRGMRDGRLVATAYFDAHRVRTHKETVMFVVGPDARIQRFELLAFAEPVDYVPRSSWYGQFVGRPLDEELSLKRGIRGVTGATLTARATTSAARRVLALHEALFGRLQPRPGT